MPDLEVVKNTGFDSQRAKAVRAKTEQAKRKAAEEAARSFHAANLLATRLAGNLDRASLGQKAFAAAQLLVNQVLTGALAPRNLNEASAFIKVAVDIGRMEAGEPTATIEHASKEERLEAIRAIRDAAEQRLKAVE